MNAELWGLIAPYVQVIRSNQTTSDEKSEALEACSSLIHNKDPEVLPDLWLLLSNMAQATGTPHVSNGFDLPSASG